MKTVKILIAIQVCLMLIGVALLFLEGNNFFGYLLAFLTFLRIIKEPELWN